VAYVDNDPIVISHARSLLAKSPEVIAVTGDMYDPGSILADPDLAGLIGMTEPSCVILSAAAKKSAKQWADHAAHGHQPPAPPTCPGSAPG
jgi:hypothetical protein